MPAAATALMLRVWPAAVARVREEVADMMAFARREAYRQFRGRDPDVRALLKKRGFPVKR